MNDLLVSSILSLKNLYVDLTVSASILPSLDADVLMIFVGAGSLNLVTSTIASPSNPKSSMYSTSAPLNNYWNSSWPKL